MPFKRHKILFFSRKKNNLKKICLPSLPKMFRSVTGSTLIFLFGLIIVYKSIAYDFIV